MEDGKPDGEWISVKEMQRLLCIGRTKSYEILAREQEIEAVAIGTAVRVNRARLDRWVRKQRYPRWRKD